MCVCVCNHSQQSLTKMKPGQQHFQRLRFRRCTIWQHCGQGRENVANLGRVKTKMYLCGCVDVALRER